MATATAKAVTPANSAKLRDKLQVKPPSEIVDWINLLVYGEAGVGKTYLGGTAADDKRLSPVLILDVEGGVTTLRHRQDIDVVSVRSMVEAQGIYNDLFLSIENGRIHYGTVIVDSLTELADVDMKGVMIEAYNKNPETVDKDVPSPREWGKTRNHMRLFVRALRDLPCHVMYTSHVGSFSEEGQPTKYFPGFAGKLRAEVPGFMDIVGYMSSEIDPIEGVITRKMQVQGTRRVVAKDRTAALGDVVENPNLPMIWDSISAK